MTQEKIELYRKTYDIPDDFYPVTIVSGVCIAWARKKEEPKQ